MKKIGKYEILEELGSGGFGTVYRARDNIGRLVAVKVLKPVWTQEATARERFRREAQAAGSLFHPNIATILDFDEARGRLYLVMRFIDGKPLSQIIIERSSSSVFQWEEALAILYQVTEGLDYAHEHGFIHRDVKPSNILISETEGAVISDFGLVKAAQSSGFTTTDGVLGTPNYLAPEIWNGKSASPSTDVYSLACVFYEMLTGQVLFDGDTTPEIMTKHVLHGPPFPSSWPDRVPEGLMNVLVKALQKEPENRYSTASGFYMALKNLQYPSRPLVSPVPEKKPKPFNEFSALISFILGLFSFIANPFFLLSILLFFLAPIYVIAGLVFGFIGLGSNKRGYAIVGLLLHGLWLIIGIILILVMIWSLGDQLLYDLGI